MTATQKLSLENLPEVFVSSSNIAPFVARELKRGKIRKLASRLYTKNLTEAPEKLVKRHLWAIVAAFSLEPLSRIARLLKMSLLQNFRQNHTYQITRRYHTTTQRAKAIRIG